MDVRRFLSALLVGLLPCGLSAQAPGDEAPEGFRSQLSDDAAPPIDPIEEPTPDDARRLDAMSWFGLAKLREGRGDFRGALDAYRAAVERDPERVAIYRGLVPLAFSLNEGEEGLKYALKLVELDPGDAGLMQQLSRVLVTQGQVAQATTLLERAAASGTVDKKSARYVSLQRDLGVLYAAQGQTEKASAAFEILMARSRSQRRTVSIPAPVRHCLPTRRRLTSGWGRHSSTPGRPTLPSRPSRGRPRPAVTGRESSSSTSPAFISRPASPKRRWSNSRRISAMDGPTGEGSRTTCWPRS